MDMYDPDGKMPDPGAPDAADWATRAGLFYLNWKSRLTELWPRT